MIDVVQKLGEAIHKAAAHKRALCIRGSGTSALVALAYFKSCFTNVGVATP